MGPLLLHSMTFYADLIARLAELSPNPHVVEVGSESGEMSVVLADITKIRGGDLYVVEPSPATRLTGLAATRDNVHVVESLSPDALHGLPTAGTYLLDGDHNYAVVTGELEQILSRPEGKDSVIVLHDVGWPCARRDMYYAPDALAKDAVHPHSFTRGVVLDDSELAPAGHGFRSRGSYAIALHEGGARNGVLTAIEDVLAGHPDAQLLTTPLVFGLGVIAHRSSSIWADVEKAMAPYTNNPTLAAMEHHRLALFLEVLRLRDRSPRARAGRVKERLLTVAQRKRGRNV